MLNSVVLRAVTVVVSAIRAPACATSVGTAVTAQKLLLALTIATVMVSARLVIQVLFAGATLVLMAQNAKI
jgi:hypothetical protein